MVVPSVVVSFGVGSSVGVAYGVVALDVVSSVVLAFVVVSFVVMN